MKRIYSILLILIMILSLVLPMTNVVYAADDREEIDDIIGESDDIDLIPFWGTECVNPYIEIPDEECGAYFDTDNGNWQRKEGETWIDKEVSDKFRAGVWRYKCNIYIDNLGKPYPDAAKTQKLAELIKVNVNGKDWEAEKSVIQSNNSRARVYSKEYIIDEPEDLIVYDSNKLDIGTNTADIPIIQYSIASCVEGGTKPYTFSKKSGPDWVEVSSDGTISGTPTQVGINQNLIVLIKDSSNREKELKISVANTEINLNNRETISEVTATSNMDNITVFGESLTIKPTFTVSNTNPAYFKYSYGGWQKKNENTGKWDNTSGLGNFEEGIWRFTCEVCIDNEGDMPNAGDIYKLANNIKVKVDGKEWKADKTDYIEEDHRSVAKVYSPEYFLTEPNRYIVEFDSNGGSFVKNDIVFKGKNVTKPDNPTKEGYAFASWFKDKELKNEFNFEEDTISAHTTLYAKWLKYYTISAKTSLAGTEAERGKVEGTGKYKEGDKVTLKAKVADGCYFESWNEDNKVLSNNETYTFTVTKDRDIKAIVQQLIDYEVKFETNGGTTIPKQTVWTNNPYAIKPADPKKEGNVFEGWFVDKEFSKVFDFKNTKIEKNTTIYAKWHKHTVTNIAAKPTTCKATGNISYYKCNVCNRIFKDSNGIQEITIASTVVPKIAHNTKEEMISKEKTKATLTKNGKIVRKYQTKCTLCGDILGTRTKTEKIYYPKTIKLSKTTFKYNKKVQIPTVKVNDSKGNAIDEENYTITYSNKKSKKVGEYKVTIKFKNKYKGTKELKYTIKPQETTLKKLKAGSKQFKAIWNKNTDQTSGYQIQYATDNKFKKNSSKELIEDNKKTSQKFKDLKEKKKYYVRIRTYKTVKGKNYYSSWSTALTVKTKK